MKSFLQNCWKHRAHIVMALPVFLILFFIMYVPMAGLVMAFKDYDFTMGIFGSPWAGLKNFQFLIASKDVFARMTKNTILYYLLFTAVGTFLNVTLAIAIDQLLFKRMAKTMQTLMIIP
ncbi:MAG: sugar ABC transporter permease, partial [Lachnospiraceae bacterium]|nr:sugar ABC transporter permease [Lachnospiraceae bacterium]